MMAKQTVLVAPDGREYTATGASEVTRLKARGYKEKPTPKPAPASAPKK